MILPDDEMPINEYGERADICVNPMGLNNRMNYGQSFNFELAYINECIVRKYNLGEFDFNEFKEEILKFYRLTYKPYYDFLMTLEVTELNDLLKTEAEEKGYTQMYQEPANENIDINKLEELLFDEFPYANKGMKFTLEGKEIEKEMKMARAYYITLKHHPKGKFSARSTGVVNMEDTPTKANEHKVHKAPISKSAVRLGNMEVNNLLITDKFDEVSRYIKMSSTNPKYRKKVVEYILQADNPLNIQRINPPENSSDQVKEKFNVLLNSLGLQIDKEHIDDIIMEVNSELNK